jgi:hypothetical protein
LLASAALGRRIHADGKALDRTEDRRCPTDDTHSMAVYHREVANLIPPQRSNRALAQWMVQLIHAKPNGGGAGARSRCIIRLGCGGLTHKLRGAIGWLMGSEVTAKIEASREPQAMFDDANTRSMAAWRTVFAFLVFVRAGKEKTSQTLLETALSAAEAHSRPGQATSPALSPEVARAFAADMAHNMIENALAAVNAAAVVFAHTVIDSAVNDLLSVAAKARPEEWADLVAEEKFTVTLRQIDRANLPTLMTERISLYLKRLANQSMPNRVQALNDCCRKCSPAVPSLPGYKFDIERIEEVDRLRRDIVHGGGLASKIHDTAELVSFMWKSNFFLITLVQSSSGLKFDSTHWLNRSVR